MSTSGYVRVPLTISPAKADALGMPPELYERIIKSVALDDSTMPSVFRNRLPITSSAQISNQEKIERLEARITKLEKDSHPPVDLGPSILATLQRLGYKLQDK